MSDEEFPISEDPPVVERLTDAEREEGQRQVSAFKSNAAGAISWPELADSSPPDRDWVIKDWIGMGYSTLLAGPGGTGKTAIMQAVNSAVCLGNDIIDNVPKPRRCLMWFGEDDKDEVWRRQVAIAQWLGVPITAFDGRFIAVCKDTEDMTLASEYGSTVVRTQLLQELREQIGDWKIDLVTIDSVARCYAGKEADRHHVTQFVSNMNWACSPTRAGNVLLGHPAKAEGSGFSGSTAWEASVRARLYFGFKMPDSPDDPENPGDQDIRYLAKRKSNYSLRDFRVCKFINGVMIPQTPDPGYEVRAKNPAVLADEAIHMVRRLKTIGIPASHAPNSAAYLPKAAKAAGLLTSSITEGDLKRGLAECLRTGRLTVGIVGTYGNRNPKQGLLEPQT